MTEALEPAEELDSYCTPAVLSAMGPRERRALVKKLAAISRALHDHGINHRDYYLCHFLLDTAAQYAETPISQRPIYLIDLHRVQIRKRTPVAGARRTLPGCTIQRAEPDLTTGICCAFCAITSSNRCVR